MASISIDSEDNIYLAGLTTGDAPILTQPANFNNQMLYNDQFSGGQSDCYFAKFDKSGKPLWGTFFGSSQSEEAWDIEVDENDNVFFIGHSLGQFSDNPVPFSNYYQKDVPEGRDAFILSMSKDFIPRWLTYFGGKGGESGLASHISNNEKLYITGTSFHNITQEPDFPLVDFDGTSDESYFQDDFSSSGGLAVGSGYIARFNIDGTTDVSDRNPLTIEQVLKISPNPTKGLVTVSFWENILNQKASLNLYNVLGDLVWSRELNQINSLTQSYDFSIFPSGVYVLKLVSPNSATNISTKFVLTQ